MPTGDTRPYGARKAEVQARIVALVTAGWTVQGLEAVAGLPKRVTVWTWAKADPDGFGAELAAARAWGQGVRVEARRPSWAFDPAKAERLLARVWGGALIGDLAREPDMPSLKMLTRWRRQRPDFAAELDLAAKAARRRRPPRWLRYDEAMADAIVLRVMRGETLDEVYASWGRRGVGPGARAVRRWRLENPEFAAALRAAHAAGARARRGAAEAAGKGPGKCTPRFMDRVTTHLVNGGSLRSAAATLRGSPSQGTLYGWCRTKPAFAAMVERARVYRDEEMMDAEYELVRGATMESYAQVRRELGRMRQRWGQVKGGRPLTWMGVRE